MRAGNLELGGKIDRYIGSLFVGAYATSGLLIVGLAVILDLASNLRFFETWDDGSEPRTAWVVRYCALNTPFLYLRVAPFVTTAAALFTVMKLVRHNELVACLNAGVSARRLLLPVYVGAAVAALGTIGLREGATSLLGERRDALRDMLDKQRLYRELDHIWLRDTPGNVVHINKFHPATNEAVEVEVIGARGTKLINITASMATYDLRDDGTLGWRLIDGVLREETGDTSTQRELAWMELVEFTPHDVMVAEKGQDSGRSMDLSFDELDILSRRDPFNLQYQTLFHAQFTFPLSNVVLLLITLPFLFGRERGKNIEGLVIACLMCMVYLAADFVTRSLGMDGSLPPLWASWSPVLVFASLGVALTESIRT